VADAPIPEELIALARQHLEAVARTKAVAAAGEPLDGAMAAERDAVRALDDARAGTEWAAWPQWQRVLDAARGE